MTTVALAMRTVTRSRRSKPLSRGPARNSAASTSSPTPDSEHIRLRVSWMLQVQACAARVPAVSASSYDVVHADARL